MDVDENGREYKFAEYEYFIELDAAEDTLFVLDGNYVEYYPNGNVKMECNYDEGNLIDIKTIYTLDGKTLHINPLINGTGKAIYLNEKGHKIFETEMKDGFEYGFQTEYYDNGQTKSTCNLIFDQKHGEKHIYYENGTQKAVLQWHEGRLTDTTYTYFPNGLISEITPYAKPKTELGKREGGILGLVGDVYGIQHGIVKKFYPNGNLQSTSTYYEGILLGISEEFNIAGHLETRAFYQEDYVNYAKYKVTFDSSGKIVDSVNNKIYEPKLEEFDSLR